MSHIAHAVSKPCVDIIVVNWNSGDQLKECLRKIELAATNRCDVGRIVVVDNASTDSSVTGLAGMNRRFVIRHNPENVGFAAACNQGARDSRADYLIFMNPDVYLQRDSLGRLIGFLNDPENYNVGICGPRLLDEAGNTQRTCARFPKTRDFFNSATGLNRAFPRMFRSSLMVEWPHESSQPVDQVMGACLVIRSATFRDLGGFDERFFVYFEEVDLCLRCKRLGRDVYFKSEATAEHVGGGCSGQIPATRLFYCLRSRLQYGFKHFSGISAALLCLVTLLLEPLSRTALSLAHGSLRDFRITWVAYGLLYRFIASIRTVRTRNLRLRLSQNQ